MLKSFRYKIVICSLLFIQLCAAQNQFNDCGMGGDPDAAVFYRNLNHDKNRYNLVTAEDIDPGITLSSMLQTGADNNRFSLGDAAEIKGYVILVKAGGEESCNCGASAAALKDTHIELVLDSAVTAKKSRIVVEVTPRLRKIMQDQGIDWSTTTLKNTFFNKWVKVQGWMFFDAQHKGTSANTAADPDAASVTRATAWEIHPVTKIQITTGP